MKTRRAAVCSLAAAAVATALLFNPSSRSSGPPPPASKDADLTAAGPRPGAAPARPLHPRPPASPLGALARQLAAAWLAETDDLRRLDLERQLLGFLDDNTAPALVRALSPDLLATPLGERALRRWAELDRASALAWMSSSTGADPLLAGLVVYGWFEYDRPGLLAALAALPPGPWREHAATAAANDALLARDGAAALDLMQRLAPGGPARDDMMSWAVAEWARQSPDAATRWALALPGSPLRERLLAATAVGRAASDPEAALTLLHAGLAPGEPFDRALESVIHLWAARDPAAASAWIASSSPAAASESAVQALVGAWSTADRIAARAWAEALPPGPLRDDARHHLALLDARLAGVDIDSASTDAELATALGR